MGLIMLILIGTVPTAYALNHAIGANQAQDFVAVSQQAANSLQGYVSPSGSVGDPRADITRYLQTKEIAPETVAAEQQLIHEIGHEVVLYKSLAAVPSEQQSNVRNDMYLASEGIRVMQKTKNPAFSVTDTKVLSNYKGHLDKPTKSSPAG
jgi:PiT family inorganic phosphate transporter